MIHGHVETWIEVVGHAIVDPTFHVFLATASTSGTALVGRVVERRKLGELEPWPRYRKGARASRWRAVALVGDGPGDPLLVELGEPFNSHEGALAEVLRATGHGGRDA